MQGMVSLIVSYITLTFSESLNFLGGQNKYSTITGFKPNNAIVTEDFQQRSSNIIDNQQQIDLIVDYCEDNLDFNHDISSVENQVRQFKSEVLLDHYCTVLIYELESDELIQFLSNQSTQLDNQPKETVNLFLKNLYMIINNFLLQILSSIDILWELDESIIKTISTVKITPFYDPDHRL